MGEKNKIKEEGDRDRTTCVEEKNKKKEMKHINEMKGEKGEII